MPISSYSSLIGWAGQRFAYGAESGSSHRDSPSSNTYTPLSPEAVAAADGVEANINVNASSDVGRMWTGARARLPYYAPSGSRSTVTASASASLGGVDGSGTYDDEGSVGGAGDVAGGGGGGGPYTRTGGYAYHHGVGRHYHYHGGVAHGHLGETRVEDDGRAKQAAEIGVTAASASASSPTDVEAGARSSTGERDK